MTNLEYATAAAEAALLAADKAQAIAEAAQLVQNGVALNFLALATQDMADESASHWEAICGWENDADKNLAFRVSLADEACTAATSAAIFVGDLAANSIA